MLLGREPYEVTLERQHEAAEALIARQPGACDTLFAVEHDPVITLGRRARPADVLASRERLAGLGISVHHVQRGGEVTYHGPGQLVLYPVVRVDPRRIGVVDLVRGLARSVADILIEWGLESRYDSENPGLWVGDAKICAVGMRIARGVSTHGCALNVGDEPLQAFPLIVPCGMPNAPVTSMASERPAIPIPRLSVLARRIASRLAERLGFDAVVEDEDSAPNDW